MSSDTCLYGGTTCSLPGWTTYIPWPSFAWQDILLVSGSTLLYTFLFVAVVYFWWANRQFHFSKRPKDGSRLSMIATKADALQRLKAKRDQVREFHHPDEDDDEDDDSSRKADDDDQEDIHRWEGLEHETHLSDYETDSDQEQEQDDSSDTKSIPKRRHPSFLRTLTPERAQQVKDLTAVVSQIEVFSYLSPQAFVQCLDYMEYVTLPQGQVLFDETTLDGSLYAVVSGQVLCQCQFTSSTSSHATPLDFDNQQQTEDEDSPSREAPYISFIAGNGDVVTSLLAMLAGLVRLSQKRNPYGKNAEKPLLAIVPVGIAVRAVGMAPTTTLVKVHPDCFLDMLDKFPREVHRIAQTIVARMQRVTLQTVCKSLGLQKEIFQRHVSNSHPRTEAWDRLQETLPNYVPEAAPHNVHFQVARDAAWVAAATILGHEEHPDVTKICQTLQAEGTVVSLPPGQTLMETGDYPNAIYLVLRGALDVGMHIIETSSLLQQSQRRASGMMHPNPPTTRRSIFPHTTAADGGIETSPRKFRRSTRPVTHATASTSSHFCRLYQSTAGDLVGQLSCFTGDASIVTVRNSWAPAVLYKISKNTYESIVAEFPTALTECVGSILDRLVSPIVCLLDFNVEWLHLEASDAGTDCCFHSSKLLTSHILLFSFLKPGEDVIQKGQ
jgi:CRP-like cAMP-binding protein